MIHCYVTVHDQQLVLDCENEGRFASVSHTYLFVGPRPVSKLLGREPVIVSRLWPGNYEDRPSFYDFTGWWTLAKHGLAMDKFLTVQYDHQLQASDLAARAEQLLDEQGGPVAYVAGHRYANNWMLLIDGFADRFNAGMAAVGVDPGQFPDFNEWPSTQGMAWRRDDLEEFMRWFEPLFDVWQHDLWAGHLAERSVWAWMMATGRAAVYSYGLVHEGRDCHGTCHLMGGDSATYAERQLTFGR